MKRITALLLALITALMLFSCTSGEAEDTGKEESKRYFSDDVALSTENFSFSRAEVSYIFHKNYSEMKLKYADSVDMYNIDTNSSLKDQIYYDDYSWFQYFADMTLDYMKQVLVFCEAAKADGIELTDEDHENIEASVKTWTDYARDYEYDIKDLLGKYYNSDVTCDTMRSFMEKETLAMKYQANLASTYKFTDEDMEKFVENNSADFYYIDYLKFAIDEDDCDTFAETADKLAAVKTADEFTAFVKDYLENVVKDTKADEKVKEITVTGEKAKEYSEYSKWAFGGAKAGETYIDKNEVDGIYTVYMLTKAPYLDTDNTKDIRIIKANISSHNSYKDTLDYVNGLLDEWKAGEATEESFALLAKEKSDDTESAEMGGAISAVARLDKTLPEELINWLFDSSRKIGDTGAVKGDACYYAVYYSADSIPAWKADANIGMAQQKMESDYNALSEKTPVQVFDDVVNSLDG